MNNELERVGERLRQIEGEASHTAWGPHYDDSQKAERAKLKARSKELKTLLGCVA